MTLTEIQTPVYNPDKIIKAMLRIAGEIIARDIAGEIIACGVNVNTYEKLTSIRQFLEDCSLIMGDSWQMEIIPMSYDPDTVYNWINECCEGKTRRLGRIVVFDKVSDHLIFTLRWL